jgi:hypothetical protein
MDFSVEGSVLSASKTHSVTAAFSCHFGFFGFRGMTASSGRSPTCACMASLQAPFDLSAVKCQLHNVQTDAAIIHAKQNCIHDEGQAENWSQKEKTNPGVGLYKHLAIVQC